MAAPSALQFYAKNLSGFKLSDLTSATLKMALLTSAYTPNTTNTGHQLYADLTNELANANGYATGGAAVASPTAPAFSTTGFDLSSLNASWTSTGTGLPAWRYGVLYVVGSLWGLASPLLAYFTGDSTPADVPLTPVPTILQVNVPANGWFTVTRT